MNKQQFVRQYVIGFLSATAATKLSQTALALQTYVARSTPPTELACIAAETAWDKLVQDGELGDLEVG